jgi:hypothetical protein
MGIANVLLSKKRDSKVKPQLEHLFEVGKFSQS